MSMQNSGTERRDRQSTEAAIIAAFERILLRDGVNGVGVNAVAQEAGVNKVLIYRYFDDLPGLARVWAAKSAFWPTEDELIGGNREEFERLSVRERVLLVLCNYIEAIRRRPQTIEMLAAELTNPTDVTRALAEGIARPGTGIATFVGLDTPHGDLTDAVWKLIYLVQASTAYLTIRERNSPSYMGTDLAKDESWQFVRDTVYEIAATFLDARQRGGDGD